MGPRLLDAHARQARAVRAVSPERKLQAVLYEVGQVAPRQVLRLQHRLRPHRDRLPPPRVQACALRQRLCQCQSHRCAGLHTPIYQATLLGARAHACSTPPGSTRSPGPYTRRPSSVMCDQSLYHVA